MNKKFADKRSINVKLTSWYGLKVQLTKLLTMTSFMTQLQDIRVY